ncbi:hypothetical protein EYC84_003892 [Monilinia fructicola]|uniref:Uncharacterized protein n=1 Tax=Monilinia fructicola TaxID=38448 RepID=A0A5M9K3Q3_MONFR|nr:hypothetical protein EYC84_003892 [Monilinia fructicola]
MVPVYQEPLPGCISRSYPARNLGTICEPVIALVSATVTTAYTLRHEQRRMASNMKFVGYTSTSGYSDFILDPSPFSLLASCLLLGCSVSSFAHRRQGRDRCQSLIFVFVVTTATTIAFGLGTNANLIMLGFIPWALIFAMVLSVSIHWAARRHNIDRKYSRVTFIEKNGRIRTIPAYCGSAAVESLRVDWVLRREERESKAAVVDMKLS